MQLTFRQRLDKPDRHGRCYLFADVTWPGGRATLPTGAKCLPAHFSPGKIRPVSTKDIDSTALNARLTNVQLKLSKVAGQAETDDVPLTVAMLRAALGAKPTKQAGAPARVLVTPADFHAAWLADNPAQPLAAPAATSRSWPTSRPTSPAGP